MEGHSFLKSSFPVVLPAYKSAEVIFEHIKQTAAKEATDGTNAPVAGKSPFMEAMKRSPPADIDLAEPAKSRTANGDGTYIDTGVPLVNLFSELEEAVSALALEPLLEDAWKADPDVTLKLIWNSRSIHLGKSSRAVFYRSVGWLYQNHPQTLLENLPWLVRPVILKKAPKPKDETKEAAVLVEKINIEDQDEEFEMVDAAGEERSAKRARIEEPAAIAEHDVLFGVSHGYWKDLLNILMLASLDQLTVSADIMSALGSAPVKRKREWDWQQGRKKAITLEQYKKVMKKIRCEPVYAALHMRVAQLFADQLRVDIERLESGNAREIKKISMAGKWAPSNKATHDTHTFITSTIVELLYPQQELCGEVTSREDYLRQARVRYQLKCLAPLRKHIDIVERHLTAETFSEIKYNRVPSLAMAKYTNLFHKKDEQHFNAYMEDVVAGKAKISGAVLQPATMIAAAEKAGSASDINAKVRDAQWDTLVQRVRNSGTLDCSIAVCDVSGSMTMPRRQDGTTPMSAAIGMSLVLAEVCKPPFGGGMITFSSNPAFIWLKDVHTLQQKVKLIKGAEWGMSTDFVAVFKRLILPLAVMHKVKPEDMVKRVFVFSDMQFDQASQGSWSTSFEEIKKLYAKAGYEMPELVFWNLAAHHNDRQSKAVQADEPGTALISGYSQAMMKVFMDGAGFADAEDEPEIVVLDEQGKEVKTKVKMTPYSTMMKALSHEAYRMLKVVD